MDTSNGCRRLTSFATLPETTLPETVCPLCKHRQPRTVGDERPNAGGVGLAEFECGYRRIRSAAGADPARCSPRR